MMYPKHDFVTIEYTYMHVTCFLRLLYVLQYVYNCYLYVPFQSEGGAGGRDESSMELKLEHPYRCHSL